jgi:curved DNA-binding protein CbpA
LAPLPDHYQILQVSPQASPSEIKQAFRRLARQYHPDLNPQDPAAEEIFRRVRAAYDVLSDNIQRRYYDEQLGSPSGSASRDRPPQDSTETAAADNPYHFYLQGIHCEAARNYSAALEAYRQAIALKPDFSEAQLHLAQMHYALAQDRSVLEDCTRLIELQSHLASAYYYQGLARSRLGYTQSAIAAFDQTLSQEPDHGQAYYQRAIAHLELQDRALAITDLHRAMECFQAQGDGHYYRKVAEQLNRLEGRSGPARFRDKAPGDPAPLASSSSSSSNRSSTASSNLNSNPSPNPVNPPIHLPVNLSWLLPATLGQLPSILFNPSANLLPLYGKLGDRRASLVGLLWIGLTYGLGLLAAMVRWSTDSQQVVWPVAIVVTLAIASFIAGIGLLRMVRGHWQGMARVLFVGGAALLPLGLLCLAMALRSPELWPWQLSLLGLALCITVLILHSGLIQVCDLPEAMATLAVPLLLLSCGWLTYWTFQTLMPPPLELLNAPDQI